MIAYLLQTLYSSWKWSPDDRNLNVLPLHHIHGLGNVVLCALYSSVHLDINSTLDAHSVYSAVATEDEREKPALIS